MTRKISLAEDEDLFVNERIIVRTNRLRYQRDSHTCEQCGGQGGFEATFFPGGYTAGDYREHKPECLTLICDACGLHDDDCEGHDE